MIDCTVGFARWAKTEVVGPPEKLAVDRLHHRFGLQPQHPSFGCHPDRSDEALNTALRGSRTQSSTMPSL
jgi:hypothetical protein